jgi:hypothetical protein
MKNSIKNFKIPTSFVLFGHKYKVEYCNTLFEKEDCYGSAHEEGKLIRLQPTGSVFVINEVRGEDGELEKIKSYFEVTEQIVVETFYHELVHIIFDSLGEESLSDNEKLVNMMGKALLEVYLYSEHEEVSTLQEKS